MTTTELKSGKIIIWSSSSLDLETFGYHTGCPKKIVPRLPEDCDEMEKDSC